MQTSPFIVNDTDFWFSQSRKNYSNFTLLKSMKIFHMLEANL